MTEEAEKLINTGEEEKDELIGGKENATNEELEIKTETHDLVVLGASGFTGNSPKNEFKAEQDYYVILVQPQASMWSSMFSGL